MSEGNLQDQVEAAIGAEPDLLLLRNTVGIVSYFNNDGEKRVVTYGLGKGSPDLVGMLTTSQGFAAWFCLELKTDDGVIRPSQQKTIPIWIRFGALVYVVRSVSDARAALAHARRTIGRAA